MKINRVQSGKTLFASLLCLLIISTVITGCSKDDDDNNGPGSGAAEVVAGTYKGQLSVGGEEFYDAIIIATDEGDSKVKFAAKSGEAYSDVTPQTMLAKSIGASASAGIIAQGANGTFSFDPETKYIVMYTTKTADTDIEFSFQGTKQ